MFIFLQCPNLHSICVAALLHPANDSLDTNFDRFWKFGWNFDPNVTWSLRGMVTLGLMHGWSLANKVLIILCCWKSKQFPIAARTSSRIYEMIPLQSRKWQCRKNGCCLLTEPDPYYIDVIVISCRPFIFLCNWYVYVAWSAKWLIYKTQICCHGNIYIIDCW